ncbi:retrovirus-related pol polyprotein from transposon TNT 1-94 [Tanacetum coccineum]
MTTLAEFMIIAGADNRPLMLEKSLYDSWKSHMEHYMENRENGKMILSSVQNGPLIWPTITKEDGTTRTKNYAELSATEKIQADCDCKATNIVLQGLDVLVFNLRDDPIACLNKAMDFLTVIASLRQGLLNALTAKVKDIWRGNALRLSEQGTLHDLGIPDDQAIQTTIPNNAAFQTEDLDAYDSDCDDVLNAKAVLMDNISNYGSDVISEVPHYDSYHNDMDNESVHAMQDFEQTPVVDFSNNEIHSDSNIIFTREKMIDSQMDHMIKEKLALKQLIDSLEQNLSNQILEKESLLQTFTIFKNEAKEKENKYLENEIDLEKNIKELDNIVYKVGQSAQTVHMLTKPQVFYDNVHKQALGYQNPFYLKKAQRIKPTLYDGSVISDKHVAMPVINDEETLILEECLVDKQCFKIVKNKLFLENDRLLQQIMSQDNMFSVMNSMSLNDEFVNVEFQGSESCDKCFNLDAKLLKTQKAYNDLLRSYSKLEKHCISLELSIQLNKEIFQKDQSCDNQNALEFLEYFENNDLKAQLQDKDTTIYKLKEHIKSMRENDKEENVKHDRSKLETINEELENSVAKFLFKNERLCNEINHVTQVFNDQFDSIKKTRVRTKEQSDSLIAKLNLKSVENEDLKAQIQDKVFMITSSKNDLRKLKVKEIVDNAAQIPNATTIVPGMFKLDLEPISHRLKNNKDVHEEYIMKTIENTNTIHGLVEHARQQNPSEPLLDYVCRFTKHVQELFLRSKDEAPEAIIKCIKNIQVRLNATVGNIRTDNGTEFVNQTLHDFYENESISHQTSIARTPQQNSVVERQNQTLVEAARTMLIFFKAPFKTPYELMHDKKPDLSFLHVFGSLCYPTNDSEDLGKLNAKADIGLVSNHIPQQPCNPPKRDDWDRLFQPMFDEYFNPPTIDVSPVPVATAPRAVDIADSHVSTSIDQDASSTNRVMLIKLKWIYKVKIDEFGGVLKNKARLVAQGFRQEEGIDFKESISRNHLHQLLE